uniref:BTB/POZ domain-containing protein n=2 Tax=Noccaea caerulescens TaxID=107243 RepID=A0A1J3IGB2_NOCCA
MSKSRRLHQLITEHEQSNEKRKRHEQEEEEENGDTYIRLENFPGGSEIFEMVVKICYGVKVDLSASTAVLLRCAAEELEMTEEHSPDNLVSKTERFLSQSVFNSIRESIKALKACESVSLIAKSIGITEKCIESIVFRASSADPSLFFGWPINNGGIFAVDTKLKKQRKDSKSEMWFEDVAELSFPIFRRLILAMKSGDLSPEIVERSLIHYAKKHIPGISSRSSSSTIASENQQRELLETIISDLPLDNSSSITATTRSLFGLLRSAIIFNTSEDCRTLLERKIGSQLEKATLDDLLIPSYSYLNETLYDVNLVERLLRHFLENAAVSSSSLTVVGKLIDGVLGEIASDANLKPEKFYNLAILLPDQARVYDDGLYRAIDIYLKVHPWISEAEKEKICSVMDSQKLTLEGCTHAAENERLPLRTVVQVLFFEQLQLRQEIAGTLLTFTAVTTEEDGAETVGEGQVEFGRWEKTVRENQVLRLDMDTMRTRVHQLERECSYLKKVIKESSSEAKERPRKWSLSRQLGCKFKIQVCDSLEAKMVDRKCRR